MAFTPTPGETVSMQPRPGLTTQVFVLLLLALPWLNPFTIGPSPAVVQSLVTLACGAQVLLVFARQGETARLAGLVAAAWLLAALLSSLLGLLQYFGATAVFGPWVNSTGLGEAYANLRQRNQFATLTNMGLAALLCWVAQQKFTLAAADRTLPLSPLLRHGLPALSVAAAVLLAAGNAASSSRTGLVQLLLLLALVWLWGGWRQWLVRRLLLAVTLTYAVCALALPALAGLDPQASGILARLHDGGPGCASRLTLWRNVLHLIAQKPWWGWGWGELDYAHFITLYPGARFCDILDNAHNLPLHLAVELGIPVTLALAGAALWGVWRAQPWREADASRQLAWAVLAMILLHSLLEYPLWYGPFQLASGLCLWLLWRSPDRTSVNSGALKPPALVLSSAVAMFLIAFCTYTAWDYHRISQIYLIPKMRAGAYRDNTLEKLQDSWLFRSQVRFAELTTTPLSVANAAHLRALALAALHFSPEPRVIEKLIESATLLGAEDETRFYLLRYRAAFPESHARWARKNAQGKT